MRRQAPASRLLHGWRLSCFSMVSTVGTPRAVAAQALRVERMFAADDATAALHPALFGAG